MRNFARSSERRHQARVRVATGGRLVVIGTQAGRRGELDLLALMQRRASIHGAATGKVVLTW